MKVTVTLFLALASILAGHAQAEYRVKVHPPIPPPPPPSIKFSSSLLKGGGGHRWSSNSLGPPRPLHLHRHPPHHHHHVPHGPAFSAFPHGRPSPPRAIIRPLHHHPHHHHHHDHVPSPPPHSHSHTLPPLPPIPPSLVHHTHHHHLPPSPSPRPSIKIPWKGPQGGKDTFHPSPPDGAQNIVATHQAADDNKGPIHTIPAPNLGPSGGHHHHSRPALSLGSFGGHDSSFQTGHGIGQGLGDAGGPYPNPVYGKPVTVNLTYHEPMATPEAQSQHQAHIPTITIQSSHGYEVHEHGLDHFVTPAPVYTHVSTVSPGGAYFAPDPDPSLPAPKVPYPLDPHSHPSNGQSPPDLEQEIPQHLLTLYGFNQQPQNVHLQPQVHLQEQHQVHPVGNYAGGGDVIHQSATGPADLGGHLLLSQALAQYEAQIQPDTYSHVNVQQQHFPHQTVQVVPDGGTVHQVQQLTSDYAQAFQHSRNPTDVSVQQAPLVSSTHETVYQTVNAPQVSGIIDAQQGHYSTYNLFANSPVHSPVLDALKEHFNQPHPTSTPAPATTVGSNHYHYQLPISTTIATPTSTPIGNAIYGQQQFVSTTVAPPVTPVANNIDFQPQIHDFTHTALAGPQNFNEIYHNLGAIALEGHQAQAVSVTNPGQAGYIPAAYHNQQNGIAAAPQVQTQVYSFGHDSYSAGSSHKTSSVDAAQVNSLSNANSQKKETVRPSSSSSFYSEKSVRGGNQDSKSDTPTNQHQGGDDDSEYYDEDVSQEVDNEDDKKSENTQPSGYGVYETFEESKQETTKDNSDQEYDDGQYEDYPTQTKTNQKEETQTNLDTEKKRKLPITNYNQNIEYGTRLKPKKNN
ncbi:uncharacterized protein LOC124160519 [Ischnura elegans]|uniref:uncharacterized protein LOC124160519 n=1 Tax=Ischnura elegans TaxID=197161 RepID=UPI001ED88BB8|nr:uncharacterized protein LOC124160519 [Ischnura elegans]